jgi:hypothetical protein
LTRSTAFAIRAAILSRQWFFSETVSPDKVLLLESDELVLEVEAVATGFTRLRRP